MWNSFARSRQATLCRSAARTSGKTGCGITTSPASLSIPRDGAGELEVCWNVAFPLSLPILAVTALGTFTATCGGSMWALLVCQDSNMWTLMVWLFQFRINYAAYPWLGMAAFVIASLPTLLVFVFCQRIILRGIIIPTEK
jgi:multiple sugar transport system permease protein